MTNSSVSARHILADAHVHLHKRFDIDQILDAAYDNFQRIAKQKDIQRDWVGVLFLTESYSENRFAQLSAKALDRWSTSTCDKKEKSWISLKTQEPCSLIAYGESGKQIVIIAGRQVVTAENLEILGLVTDQLFEDGQPWETTVSLINSSGGIPVLPWGVGKWIGRRGQLVHKILESSKFAPLFLGDNGNRPVFWPRPLHFKTADRKKIKILPGTDPLPLLSELSRPGRFGFMTSSMVDLEYPGKSMKSILLDPDTVLQSYGGLETPLRFLLNQFSVQYQQKFA